MKYANAAKIFPRELLNEMRRHYPGGMLWMPKHDDDRQERTELVIQLVENGVPVREVAALAKLTPRHVHRLVKKHRQPQSKDNETQN